MNRKERETPRSQWIYDDSPFFGRPHQVSRGAGRDMTRMLARKDRINAGSPIRRRLLLLWLAGNVAVSMLAWFLLTEKE